MATYFELIASNESGEVVLPRFNLFIEAGFTDKQIKARDILVYAALCEDYVKGDVYDLEKARTWASFKCINSVKNYIKRYKEIGLMTDSGAMVDITTSIKNGE